jgi:hypothetical protein
MEEPPPQDDDPNFSTLHPMRSPLLSRDLIFKGLFFKNWGWARRIECGFQAYQKEKVGYGKRTTEINS